MKMVLKTLGFDAAEYVETPDDEALFLSEALATNDPAVIAHTLGTIARARGMTRLAREAGVSRESLYRALSENGDPQLSTLTAVLAALGLKLTVQTVERSAA
jgi:probable addiction module antidote protein